MELHVVILSAIAFQVIHHVSAFTEDIPYKSEHCIKMTPKKEYEINSIVKRITDFLDNITADYDDYDLRLIKIDIESHREDEVEEKYLKLQVSVNDCIEEEEDGVEGDKPFLLEENNEESQDIMAYKPDVVTETTTENIPIENIPDFVKNELQIKKIGQNNKEDAKLIARLNEESTGHNKEVPFETIWFFEVGNHNNDKYDGGFFFDNIKDPVGRENVMAVRKYDLPFRQKNGVLRNKYNINPKAGILDHDNEVTYEVDGQEPHYSSPELVTLDLTNMGEDVWNLLAKRNTKPSDPLLVYIQRNRDQDEYVFL